MNFKANYLRRVLIKKLLLIMTSNPECRMRSHKADRKKILLAMKMTIFLLFSACLTVSAGGLAQKVTLSANNVKLERIFKEIKKQTGYVFFYDARVMEGAKPLSIRVKNETVEDVLKECLQGQPLDFSIQRKTVTVFQKQLTSFKKQPLNQLEYVDVKDTFSIKGTITNVDDNTPIENVSIINRESGVGTQTNKNGRFTLRVTIGDILVISHVNFAGINYEVENNDDVFVKLAPKATEDLGEVVIVGYGQQKKTSVVSSISTVSGEDLDFSGRNLSTNLQGQVPGIISFQRSGEPGYDNATFWIRGISTYNGVQDPLILVDGVPRSFNDIDPNEIATFSVLKDAAATAVYGAEGANGVILVTTKRGRIQKTVINYRGEFSNLTPLRMPEFMGSADYLSAYNEALRNEDKTPIFEDDLIQKYKSGVDMDLYPSSLWIKELMKRHTSNTKHNLSFRGGTSKARYFVAGSYYKESGLFKDNALAQYSSNIDLKRYNLRSNIDLDVTNTTLLRIDMSGQYLETNYPYYTSQQIFSVATISPPYLFPGVYSDGTTADHPRHSGNRNNPYNALNNSGYTNEFRTNIQTKVELGQKLDVITKGLSAKVDASYDYYGTYALKNNRSYNSYHATGRDANGNLILTQILSGTGNIDWVDAGLDAKKNIYLEGSLNYVRTFSQIHDVTGMALVYKKETQLSNDNLPFRKMAYVGRGTYMYDKRYSAEVNVGITGSEAFAAGHRWGIFPAAGIAWVASNEHFYPQGLRNVVSNLKFRASYGFTGNDSYGGERFLYRGGFTGATGASLGYNSGTALNHYDGFTEARFRAPNISWETERKMNFGADLGMFGNKLNLVIDYFDNYRHDILIQRATVAGAAGFNQSPFQNFGKVSNKGIESSLTYRQQIGESVFSARGNFVFARNKILEADEVTQAYSWMARTGNRLNMNSVWQADGLFTAEDFVLTTNPDGTRDYKLKGGIADQASFGSVRPGDIKYKDLNNDGLIDQFDRSGYVGNPTTPEIVYGFGVSYQLKGFSVNLFFSGIANTSIVMGDGPDGLFWPFERGVDESALRTMVGDRWSEANPSQNVLFPRLRTSSFSNNVVPSTWWIRDGSFIRLKNAELGYSVPKKVMDKIGFRSARVYLMGYNLLTWDKIKYWDPEQGNENVGVTYPQSRSFTLGLELSL